MKYHASSCYRQFQFDCAKISSTNHPALEEPEPPQQGPVNEASEHQSKRFKPNTSTNVCIFCGMDHKTVKRKTIHTLYRICEKQMAQKLLNAAKLFNDRVYTTTAAMSLLFGYVKQTVSL